MNDCEAIYEKLIQLDNLPEKEQQAIRAHTNECTQCQENGRAVQLIMASVRRSQSQSHIDDDLLVRYGVYLAAPNEPDYDGRRLTHLEAQDAQRHVDKCGQCQAQVDQVRKDYQEICDYLEEAEFPEISVVPRPSMQTKIVDQVKSLLNSIKESISVPMPRFYPVAIGALATITVVIWVGPFFRGSDPYMELASIKRSQISLVTRGGTPPHFTRELNFFQEGDYQGAIQSLQHLLSESSSEPSLYYVHYVLGLAHLLDAESKFLGRFQKFDTEKVNRAIEHLETARRLTESAGTKENCLWYAAKGYLMKADNEAAVAHLNELVRMRGRRFGDARQMMERIDSISSSP